MFTRMDQSTKEDWEHISQEHMPHILDMPRRVIKMLEELKYIKRRLCSKSTRTLSANRHSS